MLSLEDERLTGLEAVQLGALIDEYTDKRTAAGRGEPVAWFLDEVQAVAGWERLVRRLLDSSGARVFVSGSSAALLSREIATSLRGRAWQVLIHPFAFDEALLHAGVETPADPACLNRTGRAVLEAAFSEWLTAGGVPRSAEPRRPHAASAAQRLRGRGDPAGCDRPPSGGQRRRPALAGEAAVGECRIAVQR